MRAFTGRNYDVRSVAPCLQTKSNSLNSNPVFLTKYDGKWTDRRFTPLELGRLQGYDDGWLDGATLKGKPLTDTERQKLIGNALPVPMAAWLLSAVECLLRTPHPSFVSDAGVGTQLGCVGGAGAPGSIARLERWHQAAP